MREDPDFADVTLQYPYRLTQVPYSNATLEAAADQIRASEVPGLVSVFIARHGDGLEMLLVPSSDSTAAQEREALQKTADVGVPVTVEMLSGPIEPWDTPDEPQP